MENTNQKNTGNIQIAPVSAASDLNHKREGYLTWDEYFMGVAMLSGMRSKDPNSQVGACIVSDDNKILSMGYNGFPKGCSDDEFPWERVGDFLETKYPYVVHAEPNAILNSTNKLDNATLYVTLFPCNECAKLIIQSGIKEIVYVSDKYNGSNDNVASKRMLAAAGVKCRQMENVEVIIKTDDSIY